MPSPDRKIKFATALAAPVLLALAHGACTDRKSAPPPIATALGQNLGNVKGAEQIPAPEIKPSLSSSGKSLVFSERSHVYELFLPPQLEMISSDQYLYLVFNRQPFLDIDKIKNELLQIKAEIGKNPQKAIAQSKDLMSYVSGACQQNILIQVFAQSLASEVYRADKNGWPQNKKPYLDSACFWGEKLPVK